jgi:rubrerythrin
VPPKYAVAKKAKKIERPKAEPPAVAIDPLKALDRELSQVWAVGESQVATLYSDLADVVRHGTTHKCSCGLPMPQVEPGVWVCRACGHGVKETPPPEPPRSAVLAALGRELARGRPTNSLEFSLDDYLRRNL